MSAGICVCSVCYGEVHLVPEIEIQGGFRGDWHHCEDGTPQCKGGRAIYPESLSDIVGKWCGRDADPGPISYDIDGYPE